jgi:uncharacterized protein YpuA (DUF1002 family)
VLLTLLTLCLFFEILRLPTFTSAIPINRLARRCDDSESKDPSTCHGTIDSSVDPNEHFERDTGDDIKTVFHDTGTKIKNVIIPEDQKKTSVEFVTEYADAELDHHIYANPIREAQRRFREELQGDEA